MLSEREASPRTRNAPHLSKIKSRTRGLKAPRYEARATTGAVMLSER
jgi:hypothetical protein